MDRGPFMQEDGFSLEFQTTKDFNDTDVSRMDNIDGKECIFREKIILPPQEMKKASSYSLAEKYPHRSNRPLFIAGHRDLPIQKATITVRTENGNARIEKYNGAIKVSVDGTDLLFGGPILSPSARTVDSLHAAFSDMASILRDSGMERNNIARTWLFMEDILGDYDLLNNARKRFFCEGPLETGRFFPASTGIQGRVLGSSLLSLEFCAFSGKNLSLKQLPSPLQNEPTEYDKLFSRAVVINFPKNKLIFISGTASIDKTGSTLYAGDFEGQMSHTLDVIAAILEQSGGDFSNIVQATIYLKKAGDFSTCRRIIEQAGLPHNRTMLQLDTPVCRDDLLCEMEATAVVPRAR